MNDVISVIAWPVCILICALIVRFGLPFGGKHE